MHKAVHDKIKDHAEVSSVINPNDVASNDEIEYDENHAAVDDQENIILSNKSSAVGKL